MPITEQSTRYVSLPPVILTYAAGRRHNTSDVHASSGCGFTNYPADNIRAKCNAPEVELTRVWYKSNADFKGRDQAQLEAFFSSGTSIKATLQITVK